MNDTTRAAYLPPGLPIPVPDPNGYAIIAIRSRLNGLKSRRAAASAVGSGSGIRPIKRFASTGPMLPFSWNCGTPETCAWWAI